MPQRLLLLAGLLLVAGHGIAEDATALELDGLIAEALEENPSLAVLGARLDAARERVPQAGALMDPMLKLDMSNVPLSDFDFESSPMSGRQLMFTQRFPWWGKLRAREQMAQHAAEAIRYAYEDREVVLTRMVKDDYHSIAFVDQALSITGKNQALLQDFVRIAQTKFEVGHGLQQDVLRAQVSLSNVASRLIMLQQRRDRIAAHLNTILNRLPQMAVGPALQTAPRQHDLSVDSLQALALTTHPSLQTIEQGRQRWLAARELADKQRRPDIDLTLGYRQRDDDLTDPVRGSDFLSLAVAVNLPIYQDRKQDRQEAEARAQIRAAEAQIEARKQQLYQQIQQLSVDATAHWEQAELFRTTIVPQAEQSLTSALAGYQVNKVDFLTLLNNQLTLYNFEIDYYRHVAEYEKTLAGLEAVVGRRLF